MCRRGERRGLIRTGRCGWSETIERPLGTSPPCSASRCIRNTRTTFHSNPAGQPLELDWGFPLPSAIASGGCRGRFCQTEYAFHRRTTSAPHPGRGHHWRAVWARSSPMSRACRSGVFRAVVWLVRHLRCQRRRPAPERLRTRSGLPGDTRPGRLRPCGCRSDARRPKCSGR